MKIVETLKKIKTKVEQKIHKYKQNTALFFYIVIFIKKKILRLLDFTNLGYLITFIFYEIEEIKTEIWRKNTSFFIFFFYIK